MIFHQDRTQQMNIPVKYANEGERRQTHPTLLPPGEQANLVKVIQMEKAFTTQVCWAMPALGLKPRTGITLGVKFYSSISPDG